MIHKNFNSFLIILVLAISSCVSSPPEKPDNICEIFKEKRGWYKAALESEKKWKLAPNILMAFIYQESKFNANAKAPYKRFLKIPIPFQSLYELSSHKADEQRVIFSIT